jgi:flagellin-like protein
MNIKQLFEDDNAVSPVIGVILMVAITVILAAVIASFVLGLGDSAGDAAPQVTVKCNTDGGYMNHTGGDALDQSELSVSGTETFKGSSSTYTAGSIILNSNVTSDTQLIWENPESDSTSIIANC